MSRYAKPILAPGLLAFGLLGLAACAHLGPPPDPAAQQLRYELGVEAARRGATPSAVAQFESLAREGHAESQMTLAEMYHAGRGVPHDDAKAAGWYLKAARQDVAEAQMTLVAFYTVGQGVDPDPREAMRWLRRAADGGHAQAQFVLGNRSFWGQDGARDYPKARSWYRAAAHQGHTQAQFNLARMYFFGQGGPKDLVRAHFWFELAGPKGGKKAALSRDMAARTMTAEQITRARKMARTWKSKGEISQR